MLERDPVGMAHLVLNPKGWQRTQPECSAHAFDLEGMGLLFRKLKNCEVNSLKRFCLV